MKNYTAIIHSPLGKIGIVTDAQRLQTLDWLDDNVSLQTPIDDFAKQVVDELHFYFSNPTHQFKINLHSTGSEFQHKVWGALQHIPMGKALTYGELAKQLQSAPRAIGQACRTNPIPIIVPCHRIVAANHLGGYAGAKTGKLFDIKMWLLKHEGWLQM